MHSFLRRAKGKQEKEEEEEEETEREEEETQTPGTTTPESQDKKRSKGKKTKGEEIDMLRILRGLRFALEPRGCKPPSEDGKDKKDEDPPSGYVNP